MTEPSSPARNPTFDELLKPILDSAYGSALHLTRNPADAEDVVQEAAFLAFRHFDSFTPGTNFKAWFFRILMNCFYSRYRRSKREKNTVEFEETPELYLYCQTAATGLHALTEDPASALMNKLDTESVTQALEALPEEFRTVCTLYFMQDFSYQEIADMLDCPVGTVRSRLHRGRRLLQRALWRVAQERGIVSALSTGES